MITRNIFTGHEWENQAHNASEKNGNEYFDNNFYNYQGQRIWKPHV